MSTNTDLKKALEEAGIPVGSWVQTEGGATVTPPVLDRQKELLTRLRDLIQIQVDSDKAKLAELYEQQNRKKFGGGA